jgi:hypothetical protein
MFRELQIRFFSGTDSKWKTWEEIDEEFALLSMSEDFNKFRRSALVLETMEYQRLDAGVFSKELLNKGVVESGLGMPLKPFRYKNSLNLGHQYRHLKKWSATPEKELFELSRVVEFGAGFGMMCWLVFQLGFDKEYVIIDNGGTSSLQKKYLRETLTKDQFEKVKWISTLESLTPHLANSDLFIAMWSASETPDLIFENVLLKLQEKSPRILFAFQDEFKGRNNSEFIKKFSIQGTFTKVENWPSFYLCH